ncbi:MAG: crossover junction endodeoxyribonuclease RuvC [Actinomycetota bacterium]|nr:crossover junction endodeoxyribonuclease RuvC [Actinomycetota bacterium]
MAISALRILGIDPGLETTGISVLEVQSNKMEPLYCSCIITSNTQTIELRLKKIYESIIEIIGDYKPECLAIEEIFFSVNAKSAIKVGQARGVSILAASINHMEIFEYTPLQIKQALVGYGRATKQQIKFMLKNILHKPESYFPKQDDAWDAMAVCICHANSYKFNHRIKKQG